MKKIEICSLETHTISYFHKRQTFPKTELVCTKRIFFNDIFGDILRNFKLSSLQLLNKRILHCLINIFLYFEQNIFHYHYIIEKITSFLYQYPNLITHHVLFISSFIMLLVVHQVRLSGDVLFTLLNMFSNLFI